ncbi:SOS response-associated peptidase [Deinococcus hopiensis]|uniref:Abasic site processing protein n=1 Tax=Deinococcus hopiensis KR-140 TaxID=695939 RepID=A0A1W1UQS8_9DEIO|nr:SOS response-associated peptidase family protein [Deinococcus hopiensis]SMB83416.1 Putative SOS response-associated peptidase YedK [Deinococcus hopiensis KR-140]
MCNRAEDRFSPQARRDLTQLFGDIFTWPEPRDRINPADPLLTIRPAEGGYSAPLLRWGLVPAGKTPSDYKRVTTTNARVETLESKPTYRAAFMDGRRCIVPLSAFYEPDGAHTVRKGERKRWRRLTRPDGRPLLAAGLWERTQSGDGPLETVTVVTRNPVQGPEGMHDRMPALLMTKDLKTWLHGGPQEAREVAMTSWPTGILQWTTS